MWITGGRELWAQGTANAKALRKECVWNRMKVGRVVGGTVREELARAGGALKVIARAPASTPREAEAKEGLCIQE